MNAENPARPDDEIVAYWYVAMKDPDLSPRMLKRWQKWSAVPANRQAFDAAQKLWDMLGDVPRRQWPTDEEVSADTYDGSVPVEEFTAGQQAVKSNPRPSRPAWLALAAIVATVAIGLGAVKIALDANGRRPAAISAFETETAQHENVRLSDGSQIELGARTALTANVSPDLRLIVMDRGEALFTVAHDTKRPFRVLTGGGMITAVGTAFNVRRLDDIVIVTVTEGTIAISPLTTVDKAESVNSARVRKYTRGEQISYDARGNVGLARVVDLDRALAWRDRRLTYSSEPLNRVVQDINRYSQRSVAIADDAAGAILYSGTVFARDIDDWLAALDTLFPEIQVLQLDEQHVVIRMRQQETPKRNISREIL